METAVHDIDVRYIKPGDNDRTNFDQVALQELADSIREHGLAQPITVRRIGDFDSAIEYQIVAGERRFRAISQILAWPTVPCIIRRMSDEEASAIMLAENIGRKDLDPVDEAMAYQKRAKLYGWTPAEISKRCGVSPERVAKRLKLIYIREDILHLVRSGNFPVGHAEAMFLLDHNRQMIAARPIIDGQNMSIKQFRTIVDKLYVEQSQEQLFFILTQETVTTGQISRVSASKVSFPVATDLPALQLPDDHHTGAIIYQYIQDLQKAGFYREAAAIGALLYWLDRTNYVRCPLEVKGE